MMVTDNGSCFFVNVEFEAVMKANGVKHLTSVPYHPTSNHLADSSGDIVRESLMKVTEGTLNA